VSKTREGSKWQATVSELRSGGWIVLIGAAILFAIEIGRSEIPPSYSNLVEATGEPMKWFIEEKPDKVRFAIGDTYFSYDVLAGEVDAVIESLRLGGRTTVLHAPNSSLFAMLSKSGPTIWEVRHDTATIRSYRDIVRSRYMNSFGTAGIGAFFAILGITFLAVGRSRQRNQE
jgi:hypothetical protein